MASAEKQAEADVDPLVAELDEVIRAAFARQNRRLAIIGAGGAVYLLLLSRLLAD